MVVLYAMDHPDHVERVVQLGPVPRRFDTEYPASLMHSDSAPVVDSAAAARIDSLERSGWARSIRRSSARSRGGRSGCGWWDRNAPYAAGREWAQTLPNARLLTVERAAHLVTADAPGIVIPAIDAFVGGRWPERAEKITSLERGRPR
jgi:pimeloyl-ACP methyl ester carboxylesterase